MAQTNEQELFSKAFVAQGNGDLVRVTDFSMSYRNNGKQVHTLREDGAGVTLGVRESEISFNFPIGQNGFERDYVKAIQDGKIVQLRVKAPGGKVFTHNGIYTNITIDGPLDDAVKGSVSFVGKLEKQRAAAV
jgi:hypothetical protein